MAAKGQLAKQYLPFRGRPLFWHGAKVFAGTAGIDGVIFVYRPEEEKLFTELVCELEKKDSLGLPWLLAAGGTRRQDSVQNGLRVLPKAANFVLIHDAARPFVNSKLVLEVLKALQNPDSSQSPAAAVLPAIPVVDTIKEIIPPETAARNYGKVKRTIPRASLAAAQTPQGFCREILEKAFAALPPGEEVTDDAELVERLGFPVLAVEGDPLNIKITLPEDLKLLEEPGQSPDLKVGFGYDVHRFALKEEKDSPKARPLKLGGVPIPGALPVLAHSDGDVLVHALADAILGVMAAGDIGEHFPDTDPALDGLEGGVILSEVMVMLRKNNLKLIHVDLTIIAQTPKIGPHREHIRRCLAPLLGLSVESVNLKATTEEHLGFTGEKKGLKAVAVVTAGRR